MPLPLPPIPQAEYDQHHEEGYRKAQEDTDAAFGAARQAQERADAAQAQDFEQRAEAQFRAASQPVYAAQQSADFAQQADQQFEQAAAPVRAAQQRTAAPAPPGGFASGTNPPSFTGRSHSPGVEANRAAFQEAFGDLGPDVVENMLAISEKESGGRPAAHKNDAIEDSRGPLQINARAHPDLAARYDLFDPRQNARAAREVYDSQGYKAWLNASTQLGLLGETSRGARGGPAMGETSPSGSFDMPPTPGQESAQYATARSTDERSAIRARADSYLGTPYLWGGADKQGIDCSAFISRAWNVGRQTTDSLAQVAAPIDKEALQPGDALNLTTGQDPRGYGHVRMFDGWANPDHTQMYVYESSTATGGVARRVIPYDAAYTPMRLKGLSDDATPRTARNRMHASAPPAEAEQEEPGRPVSEPIVPDNGVNDTGDRPPSEFEPPSSYAPGNGRSVGGSFGAPLEPLPERGTSVGGSFAAEQDTLIPRSPRNPDAGLLERGLNAGGDFLLDRMEEASAANTEMLAASGRAADDPSSENTRRAMEAVSPVAMSLGPEPLAKIGGRAVAEAASLAPASSTVFGQFWNRARNVIAQQGDAGKELAGKIHAWRESSERLAGEWTAGMPTVRSLTKGEFRNFVDAAEGKAEAVSDKIRKAVDEWDGVRTDAYERAKEAGLDIGHLEGYFPHVFEDGTFRGKGWTDAIDHLVGSGQVTTRAEAAQKLRYAQQVRRDRRYGNLEAERELDLPFFRRDPGVLFGQGGYLESAANRIAQVAHFGEKDEGALALVDRIGREGFDAGAAKSLFDISVGATKYGPLQKTVSGALRGANTVASLGLSAITNAGQIVNTATVAGVGPTARNLIRSLRSPEAKEAAIRAGVTLDNVVQDVREGTGLASRALQRITAPGFGTVERFNRTLAFHAGVDYAQDAATKAAAGDRGARAALERLGLDAAGVAERGTLTDAEKITAGRRVVERTQFKVDPQDLPGWASSPMGKLVTQFKSFSYNQTAFMGREVIGPALKGDLAPLARFMVAGLVAGAATTETRNVIQRREPEQDPTKRVLQYYTAVGGLGLLGDVLRVTSPIVNINADRMDPDRVVTQAVGTALGPTVGKGIEVLSGISQATRGNPTPLERTALRNVPVVGTTLQNLLVPYKPRQPTSSAPPGRPSAKPPAPPRPPSPPKPPRPGG